MRENSMINEPSSKFSKPEENIQPDLTIESGFTHSVEQSDPLMDSDKRLSPSSTAHENGADKIVLSVAEDHLRMEEAALQQAEIELARRRAEVKAAREKAEFEARCKAAEEAQRQAEAALRRANEEEKRLAALKSI